MTIAIPTRSIGFYARQWKAYPNRLLLYKSLGDAVAAIATVRLALPLPHVACVCCFTLMSLCVSDSYEFCSIGGLRAGGRCFERLG